jgi:hypothetical protein
MSSLVGLDTGGADWRKASYSMANGNCVEVGSAAARIAVRDSARPDAIVICFQARAWRDFIGTVKAGSLAPRHAGRAPRGSRGTP